MKIHLKQLNNNKLRGEASECENRLHLFWSSRFFHRKNINLQHGIFII